MYAWLLIFEMISYMFYPYYQEANNVLLDLDDL